jgi:hypothetical protein
LNRVRELRQFTREAGSGKPDSEETVAAYMSELKIAGRLIRELAES